MTLPVSLTEALDRAGYFPDTASAAIERALGPGNVLAHLVRPETTFDGPQVRRHLTVLLLTSNHLHVVHVDEEMPDELNPMQVLVTTERVSLNRIHNLGLAQVFDTDGSHVAHSQAEVTLGLSWGSQRRIELERAWCDDPSCEADHGLTGTSQSADLVVRVSALADGDAAVAEALAFYDSINALTQ